MTKNQSFIIFTVLVIVLLGLVWLHTGSLVPPTGPDAIWFHAGLLTLLMGRFIVEYRFPKPNDVFVNCVAVFASISTLSSPPNEIWWEIVRWVAITCAISALILAWDPGEEAKRQKSKWRIILYHIVTRLGRAEVIFSIVFLLALVSYFDFNKFETKVFAIVWGIFLLVSHLDIKRLIESSIPTKHKGRKVIAVAHSFLAPSIVFCRRLGSERINNHDLVGFCQSFNNDCHSFGMVIGERSSATETRLVVSLLTSNIADAELNDRSFLVTASQEDQQAIEKIVSREQLNAVRKTIGTVAEGTNISQVKVEIFGRPEIRAGSLLCVQSYGQAVFYQVFNGLIEEEDTLRDSKRAFVEGEAEQIGKWDSAQGGFDTHDWVPSERSPVYVVDKTDDTPQYTLKTSEISLGTIPNSNYPVNVDMNDVVLYHTAILGVTGSGKSYLTFSLIEESARKGIKVVCIDPTGDYQRYLKGTVILNSTSAVKAFLESAEHNIGIIETASNSQNPINQAHAAAQTCLDWCKQNRTDADVLDPKPKIMLVLEEAHLLIPEWNFNPNQTLQSQVNMTSQIVLQARKYGLGFLIVSQRTANVTKSVLNQCNTIISFQAFDETGFGFLENYMGKFHVKSLPNLQARHGLLVGKASKSRRPIMVRFFDQDRVLCTEPAPKMQVPAKD